MSSKLYNVDKSSLFDERYNKRWAEVVAVFDLSKCNSVTSQFRDYPATDCVITVGTTDIVKDLYGKPLNEIPIEDAIKNLRKAAETSDYRRFKPCLALLNGFDLSQWDDLVVLNYGY